MDVSVHETVEDECDSSPMPPSPNSISLSDQMSPITPSTALSLREAALFIMKVKEIHKVSQSSL